MITYSIDTNAILRFLLLDNIAQGSAIRDIFRDAKKGSVHICIQEVVFLEAVYVLIKAYELSKREVVEKLIEITNIAFIQILFRDVIRHALHMYEEENISFADALILSHAQHEKIMLFTFDKKLKKITEKKGS